MNKYAHLAPPRPDIADRRCLTKQRYPCRAAAASAAEKVREKRGIALTPYKCPMCLRWHNTSKAAA